MTGENGRRRGGAEGMVLRFRRHYTQMTRNSRKIWGHKYSYLDILSTPLNFCTQCGFIYALTNCVRQSLRMGKDKYVTQYYTYYVFSFMPGQVRRLDYLHDKQNFNKRFSDHSTRLEQQKLLLRLCGWWVLHVMITNKYEVSQSNNWTGDFAQQLGMLVRWRVLYHGITLLSRVVGIQLRLTPFSTSLVSSPQ